MNTEMLLRSFYPLLIIAALLLVLLVIYFVIRHIWKKKNEAAFRRYRPAILFTLAAILLLVPKLFLSPRYNTATEEEYRIAVDGVSVDLSDSPMLRIEGSDTVFTLYVKIGGNEIDIVPKSAGKQLLGKLIPMVHFTSGRIVAGTTAMAWYYSGVDDYYVAVTSIASDGAEVSDNRGSTFHVLREDDLRNGISTYIYYAYIGELDDTYVLTVDGTDTRLED